MLSSKDSLTETVVELLKSGRSVELPATGYSMFPAFWPGDVVIVSPVNSSPETGTVVIALNKDEGKPPVLVMHRLIRITKDSSGRSVFITRGDSRKEPDEPWLEEQVLGVAVSLKRGSDTRKVKRYIPGSLRYRINYVLLWFYGKFGG